MTRTEAPRFTRWHRSLDDGGLILVQESSDSISEWIELDVTELPNRPDLLARLGTRSRARLLADAAACATC